jgi:Ca2+-binding RTX toxin-like protein
MRPRVVFQIFLFGLIALVIISVFTAFAAGIDIAPSNISIESMPVSAQDIKPSACSALVLTNIVRGSGLFSGTAGNDLILGSPGNDTIDGGGDDDCIVGGDGDDTIDGNSGTDVCVGGAGNDNFSNCETEIQ